jgi:hypothetical protein
MVRKQVYLEQRQDDLLKRHARATGLSEADLIRSAIDEALVGRAPAAVRQRAWQETLRFIDEHRQPRVPQIGRQWTRDSLYDERLARFSR